MENKQSRGAPKKSPTVKPSLRCPEEVWEEVTKLHKGKINKMFNDWLKTLVKSNQNEKKGIKSSN